MAKPILERDPRVPEIPSPGPNLPDHPDAPEGIILKGGLAQKWRSLGAQQWGTPDLAPIPAPGGGLWTQFALRAGGFAVMYSSARTGTFVIPQWINDCYVRVGRSGGPLGLPTGDARGAHDGTGQFQTFERGLIVWHPQLGAFEVHGAISARYLALKGTRFGYPTSDEASTPDGVGRFNSFRDMSTGGDASIYWSGSTGAHPVQGFIRRKWLQLGAERSQLGFPTSGEIPTKHPEGRFTPFQHGVIVWHPQTGAFATWGPIDTKYHQVGGSTFGYPISDIGQTADRQGQYVVLRNLDDGGDRTIVWHPLTGANELYGLIRQRYGELGYERSHLGYPTSGELPYQTDGRQQRFERGAIVYDPRRGTYADPMVWNYTASPGGATLEVRVVATSTGAVEMTGSYRSDAAVGFDYVVQPLLVSTGLGALSFSETGSVSGTHGGDEKDHFSNRLNSAFVSRFYPEFANGELRVVEQHTNKLTATLSDLALGVVKWGIGQLAMTPAGVLVVVATAGIVSAATSGGNPIPGAQIIDGTLWLAGPAGTAIALIADAAVRLATREETIDPVHYERADALFKGTLPPREQIRITDAIGAGGLPFTYPRADGKIMVNLGDGFEDPWGYSAHDGEIDGQALIHELTHVWQCHNDPDALVFIGEALWSKVKRRPNPGRTPDKDWEFYDQEQKATIVAEWFFRHYNPSVGRDRDFGFLTDDAVSDVAFRKHIEPHIRGRRP